MDDTPLDQSGQPPLTQSEMWSFFVQELSDEELSKLGVSIFEEQRQRAIAGGDQEEIIAKAFETGFERSGLGVMPWIEGSLLVCPGSLISKSQGSHRCRFVSINQEWVWQSSMLITESKRPGQGSDKGFRANLNQLEEYLEHNKVLLPQKHQFSNQYMILVPFQPQLHLNHWGLI